LTDQACAGFEERGEGIERVLQRLGLSETTWEDAKGKYEKLAGRAI